jgi:cytochrome c556
MDKQTNNAALKSISAFAIAMGLASLVGCTPDSDTPDRQVNSHPLVREWNEFTSTLKNYTVAQKDDAAEAVKEQLMTVDREINELHRQISNQAEEVSDSASDKQREVLEELKQQRQVVEDWAERLESSSESAWEDMVDGFSDAYRELAVAFANAREEIES